MSILYRVCFVACLLGSVFAFAQTQTTLTNETSNNTSACSSATGHCSAAFDGMSSSSSGTFNAAPGNVSRVSASPTSKTVRKGTTAAYSITVTPQNGYTGAVVFSLSGLPSGATASFSPTSVTTSGSTKLSVHTRYSARGTFTLQVTGRSSSGTLSSTVSVGLTVK